MLKMKPCINVGDLPDDLYAYVATNYTLTAGSFITGDEVLRGIKRFAPHLLQSFIDAWLDPSTIILVWS